MKRILLLSFIILLVCIYPVDHKAYIEAAEVTGTTENTFKNLIPDENFRKFINQNIFSETLSDSDPLDESHITVLKNFTDNLDVSKQKITDLTGISYFESISSLVADNNNIQSLDLNGLNHLESIQMAYNKLSEITLINLPALKSINVSYNQLSKFDIQLLTSLENVNCSNNEIASLDVSKNIALHTLNVENNKLEELDISKSNQLKFFKGGGNAALFFDASVLSNREFDLFDLRRSHVSMKAVAVGTQYGIVLPENATTPIVTTISNEGSYLSGLRSIVWTSMTSVPAVFTYQYAVTGIDEIVTVTVSVDKSTLVKEALTIEKPMNFVATNSAYNKVKLSWSAINGASGYRIYRSTEKDGTYSLIKTINSGATSSYVNTALSTGTTYYYKMRAFRLVNGTRYFGSYTNVISKKAIPQKVTLKLAKYSSSKIKLTWNKLSGVSGYCIYRATSVNGTYKKIKTVTSGSVTKYINTGRSKGVKYYYRIRAYCKVDGKNVYGVYSAKKNKIL